jgi:hypothetical protein
VEEYFTCEITDFTIIETLGFKKLRSEDARKQKILSVNSLFDAVCAAQVTANKAYAAGDYREMSRSDNDKIYSAFQSLQNETERGTVKCQALSEFDLALHLNLVVASLVDVRVTASKTFIRFVSYDGKLTNGKLKKKK